VGVLTGTQFLSEARFDLKNRPDTASSGLTDTRLMLMLNAAYRHLAHPSVFRHRELEFTYTITLVNGVNAYAFTPTGGVNIVSLRSVTHIDATVLTPTATRNKLLPVGPQWFDERTITSSSRPTTYAVEGNNLIIEPIPGSNENSELLFVRAIREPADLTSGTATVIGANWDEILILATRWRAELHLGYRDLAEATKLDFSALINEYEEFDKLHTEEEWDWQTQFRTPDSPMETA